MQEQLRKEIARSRGLQQWAGELRQRTLALYAHVGHTQKGSANARERNRQARQRPLAENGKDDMAAPHIIVVGASAGGVEALAKLVSGLSPGLPAAMFIVLHTSAEGPGMLPEILRRRSLLQVSAARDGAPIQSGRIYVAPPDRHLLLERDRMCLGRGPTENRHRPAIDPLFRTAAYAHDARVIGVLLSGYL